MKKYPFRFVARQGQAGVIEVNRDGVTDRCILPMEIIIEAQTELTAAQINAGIPYGLPFAEFLDDKSAIALHNSGIFTQDDLYHKAQAAVGALDSVGLKLTYVIKAVNEYLKDDHTVTKATMVAHKKKNKEK